MGAESPEYMTTAARDVLESYLAAVARSLKGIDAAAVEDALDDVRAHVVDGLTAAATAADVERMTASLGDPAVYAAAVREALEADGSPARRWSAGTLLGIPYEVGVPTAERVASRWWDPRNPRIFVPRVFGVGWDLNFGALAVRLHLIEPDAEDEPFGCVPDHAFLMALLVPVALSAFVVGSFVGVREYLPTQVPVHWDWRGQPDRFGSVYAALAMPLILSVASTAWAVWSVARRRPRLNRGATIGFATLLSATGAAVWALTLASSFGGSTSALVLLAGLLDVMAAPLVVLTALARSGRRAELRRDLGSIARSGAAGRETRR